MVSFPFLCGDEASFVVSDKELGSVEMLVFDSSREGVNAVLMGRNCLSVSMIDKLNSLSMHDVVSEFLDCPVH